ncbi:hypothetical protein C2S51_035757 [Perilla frutescens var. frutescens]|nr:hypothetical protein C2S51_035757 [Perilla frutescens var. frutescens]
MGGVGKRIGSATSLLLKSIDKSVRGEGFIVKFHQNCKQSGFRRSGALNSQQCLWRRVVSVGGGVFALWLFSVESMKRYFELAVCFATLPPLQVSIRSCIWWLSNMSTTERSTGKGSGQVEYATICGLIFDGWYEPPASLKIHRDVFGVVFETGVVVCSYAVVMVRDKNSKNIQMKYLHLADDVEQFNAYACGRVSYEYMVMATHSRYCAALAASNEGTFPRMVRWMTTQYFQYDDLIRFFDDGDVVMLVPSEEEWGFLQQLGLDRSDQVPYKARIQKVRRVKRKVDAEVEHPDVPSKRKHREPIVDGRKSPRLTRGPDSLCSCDLS